MAKKKPPSGDSVSEQVIAFLGSLDDYGLSMRQLSGLSGLDRGNLSKAARGLRPVSRTEIDAICQAMGWKLG